MLLLLGCGDGPSSPPEPEPAAPSLATTTAAALTFRQVDGGSLHTCAITTAGKVWCWGSNSFGALGNGKPGGSLRPVAVSGALTFLEIRAGTSFSCGRTNDIGPGAGVPTSSASWAV